MTSHDFFTAPIFMLLMTVIALAFRNSIKDRYLHKYYTWGLFSKFVGALALGIIYTYYYGGGDTISYHHLGHQIAVIAERGNFDAFYRIVTQSISEQQADLRIYTGRNIFVQKNDERTYFVIRVVAIVDWLTSETYSVKALVFSCFSFFGTVLMYRSFADIYPRMRRRLILICFFIPSVVFWGSGLMKDTLTYGALGLSFYGFYFGVIKRQNLHLTIPTLLFGLWLMYKVKLYILICFIPALALWFYLVYNSSIKSWFLRVFLAPVLLIIAGYAGYMGVTRITEGTEYSIDNLAEKTAVTSNYLQSISTEGGSYNIGEMDGTLTGLFKFLPQAVAVTLFRPFPWEVGFNPVRLLSAFEAFAFILLTLKVFWEVRNPFTMIRIILAEPPVASFLAFSIAFAFAVGVASGNFGALVRYKIPMMPFYLISLLVILEKSKKNKQPKRSKRRKKTKKRRRRVKSKLNHLSIPNEGLNHIN